MGFFRFFFIRALFLLRRIVDKGFGFIMSYRCGKKTLLPPIQNPLLLMPANVLAAQIRKKQIKSEQVVNAYISRIMEVNSILNAVVGQCFQKALAEARAADLLVASGEKSEEELALEKPFLGVPVTVKEHISVKGLPNTLGVPARKNVVGDEDAVVVQLMKRAGAIVIGVTNTPELCSDWADCSNAVWGRTLNAYNTTRVSGGSSGGEGSILGAAGSVIGIGTDLVGSIRFPSMFNGIFGHKPSRDVVPQTGIVPRFWGPLVNYFTMGPMCRYASDLKPMLKVLAGDNGHLLQLDEKVNLQKIKFYYMEDVGGCPIVSPVDREIKLAHQKVIKYLQRVHGIQVKKVRLRTMKNSIYVILNSLWKNSSFRLDEAATNFEGSMNFYKEFLKWFLNLSSRSLSFLVVAIMDNLVPKPTSFSGPIKKMHQELQDEVKTLLGNDGILLYPTHPTTAVYHSQGVLQMFNFIYCGIFNILGIPATHCTLGISREGLPLGIQVVSNLNNDHLCLAVAEELERGFGGWVCPPSGMPTPTIYSNGYNIL